MNKIKLSCFIFVISLNATAENYYSVITKERNKYEIEEITIPEEPIGFWIPLGTLDFTDKFPSYIDNSSAAQAKYKFNILSSSWEGDSLGYPSLDEAYTTSDLVGCNSIDVNDFCNISNLGTVYYNKSHETGTYYFEIEISGSPHSDFIGMSKGNKSTIDGIASGSLTKSMLMKVSNVTKGNWHDTEYFQDENIIQIWINYDENKISIKKLGVDDSEYNY